jgi:hypothetical protein
MLQRLVELGVDQRDGRAGVLDDVAHFLGVEPEVHRDDHASEDTHAEQAHQEAGGVGRDDRDSLVVVHAHVVERGRQAARHRGELSVRDAAQPAARRVGLVDDRLARAVHLLGALQEVSQGEGHDHNGCSRPSRPRGSGR